MVKLCLYCLFFLIIVYIMDSVDMNKIFKKNKVIQARVFYIMLVFSMTYLVTNFVYDFIGVLNI